MKNAYTVNIFRLLYLIPDAEISLRDRDLKTAHLFLAHRSLES